MKIKLTIICVVYMHTVQAQSKLKNYLNTGFGVYVPVNSYSNTNDIGTCASLNLESELTNHSAARFSIDTYRIPLLKEINFNSIPIKSNTKANITSIGLDYGLHFTAKKWRFYAFAGASVCFIDEPDFKISNNSAVSIESSNVTRWAVRLSPGLKYHLSDSFILFSELQTLSVFYKNKNNTNLLSGGGLLIGITTKL